MCAGRSHSRQSARFALVEAALGLVEPLANEQLDRVRRPSDDPVPILVRIEGRQDVVGDIARVAPARPPDADAEPKEVLAAERLGDGTQPVMAREPSARARLHATDFQVDIVMQDDDVLGREP